MIHMLASLVRKGVAVRDRGVESSTPMDRFHAQERPATPHPAVQPSTVQRPIGHDTYASLFGEKRRGCEGQRCYIILPCFQARGESTLHKQQL